MKKTLVTLFTVVLAVLMCVPSFALTLDTAEAAAESTLVPADAALAAETIVPGLNVINGKPAIETFDDLENIPSTITWGGWTAISLSTDNAVTGKAIKATSGEKYPHLYWDMVAEEGRKFYVHAASKLVQNGGTDGGGAIWWFMQDGASSNHVFMSVGGYKAGAWSVVDQVITSKTAADFSFQMQTYKTDDVYYDDLAFVPYYKITYATDGSYDQVLFADESVRDLTKLATSYTVRTDNYPADQVINGVASSCIGWSTTEGATEPMTEVALANADIRLYPVWKASDFLSTEAAYMLGKKGETFTITAAEPVEWEYDVGTTDATVETTETTLTITAAGYAGYVDVTATAVADAEKTLNISIRVIGGDYYKPGYNLWTGTADAYGFEDVDPNVILGNNGGIITRDKEITSVGTMSFAKKAKLDNVDNMAVYFSGNFPHFTSTYGTFPTIEADRPVFISYLKMGVKGTSLLSIRNTLNSADGKVRLKVDGLPELETDWVRYYATVKGNSLAVSNIASEEYKDNTQDIVNLVFMKASGVSDAWIDDIMVVPYIKITYCDADGVPQAEDFALVDDLGNFLEYYIPDNSKISGATGFALELGGEKVDRVPLGNADISIYAVKDSVTTYVYGDTAINAAVEGETFVFPEAKDVFETGMTYFKAWYVDGKNYFPGEEVAASVVVGKNIEPVEFKANLFDPVKGVLVAYADFEQLGAKQNTFGYVNTDYTSSITGLEATNGMGARAVETVDGENALRVKTHSDSQYRFGFYNMSIKEKGVFTVEFNSKAIEPKYSGTDNVAMGARMGGGFIRFNPGAADVQIGTVLTTSWQNILKSRTMESFSGTGINIYPNSYTDANSVKRYYMTDFYLDDIAIYCMPENLVVFKKSGTDIYFVEDRVTDVNGTYTFPTAEAIGMDIDYCTGWTDGVNKYKPGDEVAYASVKNAVFYAIVEDPTTPAMGFAYEGGSVPSMAKATYTEQMEDDGRSVIHIHQWGSTWDSRGMYVTDTRAHIQHKGFDASVYNVVEYAAKIENAMVPVNQKPLAEMTPDDYAPLNKATTETRIFYYTHKGNEVNFWGDGGEHLVGGVLAMPVNAGYNVITIDMGLKANGNAKYPWISTVDGMVYGLVVDPNKSGHFAGDSYIDYLRVYKGGNTTVTYATNAPEGATVLAEVAADTGRGAGTGYLLTGKRPAVEGYVFKGWATSADSTETVISIDLTGDTTLYAVWEAENANKAPAATEEYSIRGTSEENGLRFKATIKNSEMTGLEEFGFIATRKALLGDNELTFALKQNGANVNNYVSGVAYDKSEGINKINGEEADGSVIYTAVATGIPMDKKNEELVMRTYAKYTINNMNFVVYGGTMNASLYNVALEIKNAGGAAYENNKAYIDSILAE